MATATAVRPLTMTIEEYLERSFRPDREFIDGRVVRKRMGKWEHSRIQALLTTLFGVQEAPWGVMVATEWRTRVAATRVRLPDIVLVRRGRQTSVLESPPLLVVEILSPQDTFRRTQRRAEDYLRMGVETIWVIDPDGRKAKEFSRGEWHDTAFLSVPGTPIHVDADALFARLDQA